MWEHVQFAFSRVYKTYNFHILTSVAEKPFWNGLFPLQPCLHKFLATNDHYSFACCCWLNFRYYESGCMQKQASAGGSAVTLSPILASRNLWISSRRRSRSCSARQENKLHQQINRSICLHFLYVTISCLHLSLWYIWHVQKEFLNGKKHINTGKRIYAHTYKHTCIYSQLQRGNKDADVTWHKN